MKALFSFFLLIFIAANIHAHNVVGGVYSVGVVIEGEAGFSNGAMAKAGTLVKVFDEAGAPLGETLTDDEGFFVFTAEKRITHLFELNMGAGHTLKMQLPMEELPDSLAGQDGTVAEHKTAPESSSQNNVARMNTEQLEVAIAKQIKPLRREIQALKEKSGLRDIIGGIGYIFGLLGLVALSRERRLKAQK